MDCTSSEKKAVYYLVLQEHPDLQVEEGNIIQDPTDIGISDG